MQFSGPEPADLADVHSLNAAFLQGMRADLASQLLHEQLVPSLRPLIRGLTELQIVRLASAPFLLLSLRENDNDYWNHLFDDDHNRDLFSPRPAAANEFCRISAAALAFLWQLVRHNAYAARLVCGASLDWCEQLASCSLFDVLQRAADRGDLLHLRRGHDENFWRRLLGAGLSSEHDVRNAAHLCALQIVLTESHIAASGRLPAAACHAQVPTLQVSARHHPG